MLLKAFLAKLNSKVSLFFVKVSYVIVKLKLVGQRTFGDKLNLGQSLLKQFN